MKKLESSFKNMVIVLTAVTVIAGGLLGWVNELTAEPIAQANAKALSDAIAVVVPGFDNEPAANPETIEVDGVEYKIYKATKGGEFIGAAVEAVIASISPPSLLTVKGLSAGHTPVISPLAPFLNQSAALEPNPGVSE